jgi:hypothetical protein
MGRNTNLLLILALGGAALYLLTRRGGIGQPQQPQLGEAAYIAAAQAQAAIAQAEADKVRAEAFKSQSQYAPIIQGIGASLPVLAGGVAGIMGKAG